MIPHPGELAALAAAVCWTVSAIAFEIAGKRIGSLSLNFIRLVLAQMVLMAWLAGVEGSPLPRGISTSASLWLAASGFVGFVIGDFCLFRAIVMLGSRLALLIMALVPPITALLSLLLFGESLGLLGLLGMVLTVGGVAWVVSERNPAQSKDKDQVTVPRYIPWSGVLFALGGAMGQAAGLLMSRHVMAGLDPFAASSVRVLAGIAGAAGVVTVVRWWPRIVAALGDGRAMVFSTVGAVFGPFLGVTASLAAVRYTDAGTASTLMSIVPVLLILPSMVIFKERPSPRSIVGAVVAVVGVACMFA